LGRRLLVEGAVGLSLGIACGLLAAGYLWAMQPYGWQYPLTFGLATLFAILVTVVLSSVLADSALKRADSGRSVSATALSVAAMLGSAVIYLGFSYLAARTLAAIILGSAGA
jgi:hypothetical protein